MSRHYIEDSVQVYLYLDSGRWAIDSTILDGAALEPVFEQHPRNEACECESPDDCEAVLRAASDVPLPTGAELAALLNDALNQEGPAA